MVAVDHDAAPSPETDENQHKRFAQHIGPPCHGVFMVDEYGNEIPESCVEITDCVPD